jgi:hypothetical protein
MTAYDLFQPAVWAFAGGLTLLFVGGLACRLARTSHHVLWNYLASFGVLQGLAQWCKLALAVEDAALVGYLYLLLSAVSYVGLMEYARREIQRHGQRLLNPWWYGAVIAIVVLTLVTAGEGRFDAAVRYGLAIPAGIVATIALAQAARSRRAGWPLALASTATAVFVVGDVMMIAPLRAFAALGLLIGIWAECRAADRLPKLSSTLRRWRAPAVFAIALVVGVVGSAALVDGSNDDSTVMLAASEMAMDAVSPADTSTAPLEIDPRTLARQRADELRYKQGLLLMGGLAVLAVVWIGLARVAAAK